ncbi:MAG TPA: hypothetical protein PKI01_07090 [Bacteroidales bacterium]|nr:hypothetical protein [Bacteroidales bacterium]
MKTKILLILLIFICLKTQAQVQILFQSNQTKSYLLSYTNSYEESQQVINEMIDAIAKFVPKPVNQTKIMFNVDENVKITRNQTVVSIYVTHQNIIMSGDVFYKGFNMTDVLVPSKYDFKATLSYTNGTKIKDFVQQTSNFTPPFNEVLLQCNDTALSNSYNFEVTAVKFYYDYAARNRFREKAGLIDQYFSADLDLNDINKKLGEIDLKAFEYLENSQSEMNKLKALEDNISNAAFWQALHIEAFDPLKLNMKLFDVKKKHTEIQNQLNYTKSVIHELYYDKGVELYNNKKAYDAKTAFEKSLSYNPSYAPSQFYLAQIAFETNKTEEAKQLLKKLFTLDNIDGITQKAAFGLVSAIEWRDMNSAAGLLTGGKFTEALAAVDKAESFCKSIPSYTCNDTIELIRRDCHLGIYNSYLKSGENLFNVKKYKEAGNEVLKAILYQQKFSGYIPNNDDALALKQKIGIEEYYQSMTKGKEKMISKEYRAAFSEFDNASILEKDYPVKKDRLLPELLKKSKLEVLFLDIDNAESDVKTNNLTNARNILRQVIDEQKTYGLNDNSALSVRIENLKKSIFSQECMNAQKEYDSKTAAAANAENEKNFISAETNYNAALLTVEKNPDCDINNEVAKKGKLNVEKPSQYQQQLNQCNDLVKSNSYYKAIESYNKLSTYYNSNSIINYGITHQPLHLYIASFESGFVTYGLNWLIDNGETDNAMFLLKLLKQRNILKSTTKIQQTSLARAFAIRDHNAGMMSDPKVKVTEYTLGDKWFSYFSKEYVKQIKKLK